MGVLLGLGGVGTPSVVQGRAPAFSLPPVTTQRPMQQARAEGVAVRPVQYRQGFSIPAHRNVSKTLRKLFASFSCCTAKTVNTLRRNAVSAARAGSFDVFAMPALSAVCHW